MDRPYKCIRCKNIFNEIEDHSKTPPSPYIDINIVGIGFENNKAGICQECRDELSKWLQGKDRDEWVYGINASNNEWKWNMNGFKLSDNLGYIGAIKDEE